MALEFVVSSNDAKLNRVLLAAVQGADEIARTTGRESIFTGFRASREGDGEAACLVRDGCEAQARKRVEEVLRKRSRKWDEFGLRVFLREALPDCEYWSSLSSFALTGGTA